MRVVVARVDPLAGDAVVLGCVPANQRLPDVVVREVAMLVVRRVEIGQINMRDDVDERHRVTAHRDPTPGKQSGARNSMSL